MPNVPSEEEFQELVDDHEETVRVVDDNFQKVNNQLNALAARVAKLEESRNSTGEKESSEPDPFSEVAEIVKRLRGEWGSRFW